MAVYYAGIGSRKAPQAVLDGFYRLGKALAEMGLVLRSGRAEGADSYFERGCIDGGGRCEIYVPWPGFPSGSVLARRPAVVFDRICGEQKRLALESIAKYHPAPDCLGQGARKLMARNYCQVHGSTPQDTKTAFIACWTPDGKASGGTGQAVRMAQDAGAAVFNARGYEADMDAFIGEVCRYAASLAP